jgi:hypothetical protein
MEELLLDHGIRYTHVPYKGTTDQMLALAGGDVGKVQADEMEAGRMQPAQAAGHLAVDDLVVQRGGLPAHAADQADGSGLRVGQGAHGCVLQ